MAVAPEVSPELAKQQAQLATFNEYIHTCRDLYKQDPTMVSLIALPKPFV